MKPLYDREQIMGIIPHRDPFLLVDEILSMDEKTIVGAKHVNESEYYFAGHFPEHKVMPGVLIVETLAQTGAVSILGQPKFAGKIAFLGAVKNAKFRRQVSPGDHLRLVVTMEKLGSKAGTAIAEAYICNVEELYSKTGLNDEGKQVGQLACQCEITFVIG